MKCYQDGAGHVAQTARGQADKARQPPAAATFVDARAGTALRVAQQCLSDGAKRVTQLHAVAKLAEGVSTAQQVNHRTATSIPGHVTQLTSYHTLRDFFANELPNYSLVQPKSELMGAHITEAEEQLPFVDFVHQGVSPAVDPNIQRSDGKFTILFDRHNQAGHSEHFLVGAIIHELIHVANARKYNRNNHYERGHGKFFNLHLDKRGHAKVVEWTGPLRGLTPRQRQSFDDQYQTLMSNWNRLDQIVDDEKDDLEKVHFDHLQSRVCYGGSNPAMENDTALTDIVYYMEANALRHTETYSFAFKMLNEARDRRNHEGQIAASLTPDPSKSLWQRIWIGMQDNPAWEAGIRF